MKSWDRFLGRRERNSTTLQNCLRIPKKHLAARQPANTEQLPPDPAGSRQNKPSKHNRPPILPKSRVRISRRPPARMPRMRRKPHQRLALRQFRQHVFRIDPNPPVPIENGGKPAGTAERGRFAPDSCRNFGLIRTRLRAGRHIQQ